MLVLIFLNSQVIYLFILEVNYVFVFGFNFRIYRAVFHLCMLILFVLCFGKEKETLMLRKRKRNSVSAGQIPQRHRNGAVAMCGATDG